MLGVCEVAVKMTVSAYLPVHVVYASMVTRVLVVCVYVSVFLPWVCTYTWDEEIDDKM